jgi:ATP-dependent Zn protease
MDDPTLISRQQLFARIVGGLGGRAAEEVIFGEPEVTTGAAGDLQQITGLAKQVCSLYMRLYQYELEIVARTLQFLLNHLWFLTDIYEMNSKKTMLQHARAC